MWHRAQSSRAIQSLAALHDAERTGFLPVLNIHGLSDVTRSWASYFGAEWVVVDNAVLTMNAAMASARLAVIGAASGIATLRRAA